MPEKKIFRRFFWPLLEEVEIEIVREVLFATFPNQRNYIGVFLPYSAARISYSLMPWLGFEPTSVQL